MSKVRSNDGGYEVKLCTTYCGHCGQLVSVTYQKTIGVHFASVKDATPCVGSYSNAFKGPTQKKDDNNG